jgi:hypothetical protein
VAGVSQSLPPVESFGKLARLEQFQKINGRNEAQKAHEFKGFLRIMRIFAATSFLEML